MLSGCLFLGTRRNLFYQPVDEKIKTWPLHFPAKENPNMRRTLFDWPIVLRYDVKAKCRLISRKLSGMRAFYPSVRLTNQNPTRVCIRSINQSNCSVRSFVVSVLFARFHFKVIRKSLYQRGKKQTKQIENHLFLPKKLHKR